jgi:hypothetical protein
MFIVFTADDAIQSYTINAVNNLLAGRKNPNNCPIKMTCVLFSFHTQGHFEKHSLQILHFPDVHQLLTRH